MSKSKAAFSGPSAPFPTTAQVKWVVPSTVTIDQFIMFYDDSGRFLNNHTVSMEAYNGANAAYYLTGPAVFLDFATDVPAVPYILLIFAVPAGLTDLANGPLKLNYLVFENGGNTLAATGELFVGMDGKEILPQLPLGISVDEVLDTIAATVSGTSSGAGTGTESFQGLTGIQRVRSTIVNGNRTAIHYGP